MVERMRKHHRPNINSSSSSSAKGTRTSSPQPQSLVFQTAAERSAKRAQCLEELEKQANPAAVLDHRLPLKFEAGIAVGLEETHPVLSIPNRPNRPRVPLFVPPRKAPSVATPLSTPHDALFGKEVEQQSLKTNVSAKETSSVIPVGRAQPKPRPQNTARRVLAGIHCVVWGDWADASEVDKSSPVVILIQKSKEDFDFITFLECTSTPGTRFVLLEEWCWGSSLLETIQVLLRTVCCTTSNGSSASPTQLSPLIVCAAGIACWTLAEILSALRTRTSDLKIPFAAGFLYVGDAPTQVTPLLRLSGLAGLSTYVESETRGGGFEMMLRTSEALIWTCETVANLSEFLRSQQNGKTELIQTVLTQYVPTVEERLETIEINLREFDTSETLQVERIASGEIIAQIMFMVCDVQSAARASSRQMVRLWTWSLKKKLRAVELPGNIVLNQGDVISAPLVKPEEVDWDQIKLLSRRDDPLRAAFVRLATRHRNLPMISGGSPSRRRLNLQKSAVLPVLPLSELLSGESLEEGRRDFHVKLIEVDDRKSQLLVWDESIPLGTFCRIRLNKDPSSLHRPSDFHVGSRMELRNVRIELLSLKNEQGGEVGKFRAFLDNQSGRAYLDPVSAGSFQPVKFANLQDIPSSSVGEYRVRARIQDVLFQGFSYRKAIRTWRNIFTWTNHLVEQSTNGRCLMKDFSIVLVDVPHKDDDQNEVVEVTVRVRRDKVNEVLPFVDAEQVANQDLDVRHKQLLFLKQILDALTYPGNKLCEFALRVHGPNGPIPELLTMDV